MFPPLDLFYLPALGASIIYGSDALFGKLALDNMPLSIFTFLLAFLYSIVALMIFLYDNKRIIGYFKDAKNWPSIGWGVVAIVVGTKYIKI